MGRGTGKRASLAYSRRIPPDLAVNMLTAGRPYCRGCSARLHQCTGYNFLHPQPSVLASTPSWSVNPLFSLLVLEYAIYV